MNTVLERFLRYAALDTQSEDDRESIPSTERQFDLARIIAKELEEMGASNVELDEHCYIYAEVPGNLPGAPSLAFIAHMDTAPIDYHGAPKPRIVENYPGGPIVLSEEETIWPKTSPELEQYIGQDIIVTDGTTLLGADDKAGVAEIMALVHHLLTHPEIPHGRIAICFTPDEEVGRGAEMLRLDRLGADFGYTVDGGGLGEIEYMNFNAASAKLKIKGVDVHPGTAKGTMLNALQVAWNFHAMLPPEQRPEHTEGFEGFFHLMHLEGSAAEASMAYLIREHDDEKFEARKQLMRSAATYINQRYGDVLTLELKDSYRNMAKAMQPHMHLVDTACKALSACGVEPMVVPIRGGTDGVALTFRGLPCPNLCTGGHNFHSRLEYIPVQSLEKMVAILLKLVELTYTKD